MDTSNSALSLTGSSRMITYGTTAISAGLAFVSGYETYYGLLGFMGGSFFGQVASFALTLVVQTLVFLISLQLATRLRDGFASTWVIWLIWALCAAFSMYFSYFGFLQMTGGRNSDIRILAVNQERDDLFAAMRSSIEADIQATLDNRITGAAKTWVDEAVRPLAQSAMAQKTAILSAARKTREDLVAQDQVLRDELAKLDAKRREAQAAADAVARELEAAQKDHDALATKLEGLKADRGKAASDLSALQTQAEGEGRTGKGERYNNLVVELNTLKSKLEGLTANVTQTETALQAATQRLDAAKVNANDNVEARTLAAIQDDAKKKVASRAELASQIKTAETGAAFDFDSQVGKLDTELNALNSRDFAAIERISEVCNQVKQMLGTLDRGGSQGTDCSNAEIAKAVEAAKAQRTKLADFEASCIKQPAQIEEVEGKDAKINGVIDQLNSCLSKVVSDQVVREELNVRIATLKAQRGDNVDPITMAKVALSQDMQGNAVMSAFFAVIIELLVLLCSLMGQMAGLSQRVRGIDVVITKARPVAGGHAVYERQLDLTSLSPKQKASVENVVGELIRRELVDLVDQEGNLLMLKRGGMTQLVQLRNSAAAPVAQSATANPAAAGPVTNQPKKRRGLRN